MSELHVAIQTLVARWAREVAGLAPPLEVAQVEKMLRTLSAAVPEEVVTLYCGTGGMKDSEMDNNLFSLWPLDKVIAEAQQSPGKRVEFGDFFIDSHRYAMAFTEGKSEVWINAYTGDPSDDHLISESLTEFFVKYANASSEDAAFKVLHGIEEQA